MDDWRRGVLREGHSLFFHSVCAAMLPNRDVSVDSMIDMEADSVYIICNNIQKITSCPAEDVHTKRAPLQEASKKPTASTSSGESRSQSHYSDLGHGLFLSVLIILSKWILSS